MMYRYNHNKNNSLISNCSSIYNQRYRSATEVVLGESQVSLIDEKLQDAQSRLKLLCRNTQTNTKELKNIINSIQKTDLPKTLNEKQKRNVWFISNMDSKQNMKNNIQSRKEANDEFNQIRYNLNLLERKFQDYQNKQIKICKLEVSYNKMMEDNHIKQIQFNRTLDEYKKKIEQLSHENKIEKEKVIKFRRENEKMKQDYETKMKVMEQQHKQRIQQIKINFENYYLTKQQELIDEINNLQQCLKQQLENKCKNKQKINQQKRQLQNQISYVQNQFQILKQKQIKNIEELNQKNEKIEQLQHQVLIIRQNNQRFLEQINNLRNSLELNAKQTLCVCQLLLHSNDILNRINNNQLLATVVMIKQQLNIKRPAIKSLIAQITSKYCFSFDESVSKTADRSKVFKYKEDITGKGKKYISDEKYYNTNSTEMSKQKNKQFVQTDTSPFSIQQYDANELYHIILLQAQQIQKGACQQF